MSPNDPLAEAGRWLDAKLAGAPVPTLLLVIGLGEGHLLDVLEARAPETKVLALEPDRAATRAFRARRDWSAWLHSGRLIYLEAPHYRGSEEAWSIFPARSEAHVLLTHPSIEARPGPAAVEAARVLKKILFGARANAAARLQFAPRYLSNSLRNLPAIVAGSDVRALDGAFRGIPAVVVGAGPSLDGSLGALRDLADHALVISTDTALRPLATAGTPVPLVVGLDPGAANAKHFMLLPETPGTWLVSESALDPIAGEAFHGRTFWFRVANHHPWPWYAGLGVDVERLDVWASTVDCAAFQPWQCWPRLRSDRVCRRGPRLHATDAPTAADRTYEFEWALAAALGRDLGWIWDQQLARSDRAQRPDLHGGETTTTPTLAAVRDWLVEQASRSGRISADRSRALRRGTARRHHRCRGSRVRTPGSMRVLHLTSFVQGGAGRAIAALAAAQRTSGHEVVVITSATGAPGYGNYPAHLDALRRAGVPFDEVDSLFTRDESAHQRVVDHVERQYGGLAGFDIVHAHAAVPSAIALRLRQRVGVLVPVLQTMHGWGIAKTPAQRDADVAALHAIDRVVVPAPTSLLQLGSLGIDPGRIQVIPYGVPPRERGASGGDPLRAEIASWRRNEAVVLCCVGTIGERKNQRLVVDALQALGNPRLRAVFVGDGDVDGLRERAARAGLAAHVRVTGYRNDARDVAAACDVLVLPSLSEGQPLAILEAFCDGVPVVASAIPELQELVSDGVTGWLADPNDADSLARVLTGVLTQDTAGQIALIERAQTEWRASYSLERMISAYKTLYRELTGLDD